MLCESSALVGCVGRRAALVGADVGLSETAFLVFLLRVRGLLRLRFPPPPGADQMTAPRRIHDTMRHGSS